MRGNAEADRLAKLGVEAHRVSEQVREEVQRHADLQYDLAKWLGQVTTTAGKWLGGGPVRDTAASRRRANAEAKARGTHSLPKRRARRVVTQRPTDMGGHRLVRGSHKWQCTVCKMSSRYWSRIAGGQCKGSVAKKWAVKAQELAVAKAQLGCGHDFLLSETSCGAPFAGPSPTMGRSRLSPSLAAARTIWRIGSWTSRGTTRGGGYCSS